METQKKLVGPAFIERLGEDGWTYIKTVVDILREPILILDEHFRVIAANDPFYKIFQVDPKDTENKTIYALGNGQWDIPDLRKLLEDILPKNTFFRGFEVAHEFPIIGSKVMILNAREIHCVPNEKFEPCPPIILLAIEDITEMIGVAKTFSTYTKQMEDKLMHKTEKLEELVVKLEKEISELKTKI